MFLGVNEHRSCHAEKRLTLKHPANKNTDAKLRLYLPSKSNFLICSDSSDYRSIRTDYQRGTIAHCGSLE